MPDPPLSRIGSPLGSPRRRRMSSQARHRRRRAVAVVAALAAVGLIALVVVLILDAGTSPGRRSDVRATVGRRSSRTTQLSPAARERVAENAAITRTLAYTPYVRIAGSQHREVALTFDDGPGPYTPEVLDILERDHVPGTFFEVGIEERYFSLWTKRIVRDGYPIGDHTETHPEMSRLNARAQSAELLDQTRAIGRYGAPFPRLFRPPYSLWNNTTLSLLKRLHMLMILWTVDTNDYERPGVDAIVESAERGARPGAIILLHDAGGDRSETVAALPRIIRNLRARGYRLVTVPRLLLDNPAPQDQDIVGLTGSG